jgi:hypothetical protein
MPALVQQCLDLEPVSGIAGLGSCYLHVAQVTDSSSSFLTRKACGSTITGAQKASPSPFVANWETQFIPNSSGIPYLLPLSGRPSF